LATSDTTKGLIPAEDAPAIADRAALAQVMRVHNVQVAIEHGNVRKLRNGVLGLTALLAVIMSVAAIVTDQEHRIVIGVGAIAGTLTTVMAVTSTQGAPGRTASSGRGGLAWQGARRWCCEPVDPMDDAQPMRCQDG